MGYSIKITKNFVSEIDLNCADLFTEGSVENFSMRPRDCFCVKIMAPFCPSLKSLPESKVKRFILITLKKEI